MSKSSVKRKGLTLRTALTALVVLSGAGLLSFVLLRPGSGSQPARPNEPVATGAPARIARQLSYEVVGSYPHDPAAFLQGLVWHDGGFYESTGLEGRSTLRRVEFPSGKVVQSVSLSPDLFGEGLALVANRLIQLTYTSHRGFVYDRGTFRLLREFSYETEGWGLAYDGKNLIMSDGSAMLTFLDPETFQPVRKLAVVMNGQPVASLNELEFVEGEVWANVWRTDLIVCIDPDSGQVGSFLKLAGILPAGARTGNEDVLNGIAYDAQTKRIFVSGKLWSKLIEIRVHK